MHEQNLKIEIPYVLNTEIAVCVPRLNILCEIPGEGVGGMIKIQVQLQHYSSAAQTM